MSEDHVTMLKQAQNELSRASFVQASITVTYGNGEKHELSGLKYKHMLLEMRKECFRPYRITHIPSGYLVASYRSREEAKLGLIRFSKLVTSIMMPEDFEAFDADLRVAARQLRKDPEADITKFLGHEERRPVKAPPRRSVPPPKRRVPGI